MSILEEADIGKIKWSFEITNSNKVFDTVEMYFDHTLYQNGNIQVLLSGDTGKDILLPGENLYRFTQIVKIIIYENSHRQPLYLCYIRCENNSFQMKKI